MALTNIAGWNEDENKQKSAACGTACRPRRTLLAHAVYCLEYEESIFNWERYFATVRRAIFIPRSSKMSAIF